MTCQKIFAVKDKLQLLGDWRDIAVPAAQYKEVVQWCKRMRIKAEIPLNKDNKHIAEHYFGLHLWRVQDEQHRMWFLLRFK